MKITNIYKVFALAVLFVTLQSRSNGPGSVANLTVTGAPGNGTCANMGCHVSGSFDPSASIELLEGANTVSVYQPGNQYTLKVNIVPGNGSPAHYGFQAVSLNGANNQSGNWGNVGAGKKTVMLGDRNYVEHSIPSSSSSFEMEWIAPASGSGEVTFYAAGIASNNNGGATGDGMANTSLKISEDPTNSAAGLTKGVASLKVMPNPVYETLNLGINSQISGEHQVRIIDVLGKVIETSSVVLQNGEQVTSIPVGHLASGLYVVQLCGDGHLAAKQMLKR